MVSKELCRLIAYKNFQIQLLKQSPKTGAFSTMRRVDLSLEKENRYAYHCHGGEIGSETEKTLWATYRLLTDRFHRMMEREKKSLSERIQIEELKKRFKPEA